MITIKSPDLSEQQLAEIALAIQKRWEIPVFVKMHEIILVDDEEVESDGKVITVPLDRIQLEKGLEVILENLDMQRAFNIKPKGRNNFSLNLVDPASVPQWMSEVEKPQPTPEGVFACPHCGKWFRSEIERSLHQKLHYIV